MFIWNCKWGIIFELLINQSFQHFLAKVSIGNVPKCLVLSDCPCMNFQWAWKVLNYYREYFITSAVAVQTVWCSVRHSTTLLAINRLCLHLAKPEQKWMGRGTLWRKDLWICMIMFQKVKVIDYDSVGSLAWCKANFRCGITFMFVCIFAKLFPLQFNLFLRLE